MRPTTTHLRRVPRRRATAVAALVLGAGGLLLPAACAGGSGQTTASSDVGPAGGAATEQDQPTAPAPGSPRSATGASARQAAVTPASRSVVSTGEVGLTSRHPEDVRADVRQLVASWGGSISQEESESDARGRLTDSRLVLRVPAARFDAAMEALGDLGRRTHQDRRSEDVGAQVVDTDARVRAAERSIRRIEDLLGRAQRLSDVISIEDDLAQRQADLDSLRSQQAWLRDQTSMSTITLHLARSERTPREDVDRTGFVGGLHDGWDALRGAGVVVSTALGAALPFAVLLVLLGVPLRLLARRLSRWSARARTPSGA